MHALHHLRSSGDPLLWWILAFAGMTVILMYGYQRLAALGIMTGTNGSRFFMTIFHLIIVINAYDALRSPDTGRKSGKQIECR
ncbi:hypothetical protein ACH42_15530 [Endozoicomonas sp. (ex Bugula neritina AB1)]|nr:hypothetical protein ACH42_15530 [Endozoicomonas sp. (ex Bugula neritina AB1)]